MRSATTGSSSSSVGALAAGLAELGEVLELGDRRRASAYRRAFSTTPATSAPLEASNSTSDSENSRGASVWSVIVPIGAPSRPSIGTETSDWKRSSSISRHVLEARVALRALADERRLAALDRRPRETLAARSEIEPASWP